MLVKLRGGYISPWAIKCPPPSTPHTVCLNNCPEYLEHLTRHYCVFAVHAQEFWETLFKLARDPMKAQQVLDRLNLIKTNRALRVTAFSTMFAPCALPQK